jgi:hypothetical protein
MRAYARRVLLPLARPLLNRVDARMDHRIYLHERGSAKTALNQHLPSLLNAISTQNAAARELRRAELRLAQSLEDLRAAVEALDVRLAAVNAEVAELWVAVEARPDATLAPTRSTPSS